MLSLGLALSAGFCAAMASLCVKLALSSEDMFQTALCKHVSLWKETSSHCKQVVFLSRIILFGLMFLFNGLMWTLFVKSLRNSSSSAQAMITNSASNFIFSALFGMVVFGEILSLRWWMGASFIILGLFLINKNMKTPDGAFEDKDKEKLSAKKHS